MRKTGIFLITLLAFSGFILLASLAPVQADEGDHTITITAKLGAGNKYDKTEVNLEPDTEYTIIFVNEQSIGHNLRIDKNDNIEDNGNVDDSNDIVVGYENNHQISGSETYTGSWNATWTTPADDGEYVFYCGFTGHYPGMEGIFIVGEGDAPGFGLFFALSALFITAIAVPRLRRN